MGECFLLSFSPWILYTFKTSTTWVILNRLSASATRRRCSPCPIWISHLCVDPVEIVREDFASLMFIAFSVPADQYWLFQKSHVFTLRDLVSYSSQMLLSQQQIEPQVLNFNNELSSIESSRYSLTSLQNFTSQSSVICTSPNILIFHVLTEHPTEICIIDGFSVQCSNIISDLLKMLSQIWHSNTHSWYQLLWQIIIMEKEVYYIIQFLSHTPHWRNLRQELNRGIWRQRQLQRPWLSWSAANCFTLHGLQSDLLHPTPQTQVWHDGQWGVHTNINHLLR